MECAADEEALQKRLHELVLATPDLGYRALHAALQAEEHFQGVGLKRVQKLLRDLKAQDGYCNAQPPVAPIAAAGDSHSAAEEIEPVTITRPDVSQKFGMMIDTEPTAGGGHRITQIRSGGVVDEWNQQNPSKSLSVEDILVSVNGKTSFEDMMEEFKQSLSCTLQKRGAATLRVDDSEGRREAKAWEERRARVTAALIPGLKKIVDSEFGAGASERIGRVEKMYQMVGRNEVHEEDGPLGRRYAPGYMEGLVPVKPFHTVQDYPWCAELRTNWKSIRKELRNSLDESLWTPGAYQSSNEAYGKDWKIMGVLTSDKWQDEVRFKATTGVIKKLQGIKPFEAFFAKMPPHTKIAPHSDNLSYVLTSHLALDLEEGACSITVGNEERKWKEGEMIVIDTTFIHSTKNESSRPRYILVLRFWHPGLTEEERRAIHVSHAILAKAAK